MAGLAAIALVTAACSGGSSPSKATPAEEDCSAVVTAARSIPLIDPTKATPEQVDAVVAGADRLETAAAGATTAVAGPARILAGAAEDYATALAANNVERAVTSQGRMRHDAAAVAKQCGEAATRILGS
jgi:hypothetical protein